MDNLQWDIGFLAITPQMNQTWQRKHNIEMGYC